MSDDLIVEFKMKFAGEVWGKELRVVNASTLNQHEIAEEMQKGFKAVSRSFSGVVHGNERLRDRFNYKHEEGCVNE
jgi:hypothetical protein